MSLPNLYVTQVVRLLEELEGGIMARDAETSSTVGVVIGYSSGLLPALLVVSPGPFT